MQSLRELIKCECAYNSNIFGRDIGVAVVDTGVFLHKDFEDRIIGFRDIVNNKNYIYDDNGHGTHVAGIIGGKVYGIAPKCKLICVKVLDKRGSGNTDDIIEGINWIIENRNKYNIKIINISVGTLPKVGNNEKTKLIQCVDKAWDSGLVVIAAAGNNGPLPFSITTPGISRKVITVGASDDDIMMDLSGRKLKNYSGRGPTPFCIVKPEIVAPGSNVISCINKREGYISKSGTSMSTPVVSGVVALMLEKYKNITPKEVKLKMYNTSIDMGYSKNKQGWGLINVPGLLEYKYSK